MIPPVHEALLLWRPPELFDKASIVQSELATTTLAELQRFTHRLHARIIRIEGEHLGISSCGRSLLPCVPIRWTFASGSRPRSIITTARSAGSPESSASAPP